MATTTSRALRRRKKATRGAASSKTSIIFDYNLHSKTCKLSLAEAVACTRKQRTTRNARARCSFGRKQRRYSNVGVKARRRRRHFFDSSPRKNSCSRANPNRQEKTKHISARLLEANDDADHTRRRPLASGQLSSRSAATAAAAESPLADATRRTQKIAFEWRPNARRLSCDSNVC